MNIKTNTKAHMLYSEIKPYESIEQNAENKIQI